MFLKIKEEPQVKSNVRTIEQHAPRTNIQLISIINYNFNIENPMK